MFENLIGYGIVGIVALVLLCWLVLPGFALIKAGEVGILIKKMFGKQLPQGKIIAVNGEIGIQSNTLMPGLYWRFPIIWKIKKVSVVEVPRGMVGLLESIDGQPIAKGRLLGDEVDSNSFQDATLFLNNGGMKGPQIGVLRPGSYRINQAVFKVSTVPAIRVPQEQIGVVISKDGIPLPSGFIVALTPTADHKHFQDGQAFIDASGYRGPQLETLQPGEYYINTNLFDVLLSPVAVVPPGYVAVVISSVGKEITPPAAAPSVDTNPSLGQTIHESVESLLITDKNERGILKDPVTPGKYNLNTIAYKVELVPTSAVTIDWASTEGPAETRVIGGKEKDYGSQGKVAEFFKFSQLRVTSKDGFLLDVDVRLIIRVPAPNAPFVIARFGTVQNLIEQVAHPLIDSSFRNEAGKKAAMEFVHSRTELQMQALDKAREEFARYHVEVQGLLIAYIDVDKSLLETQTKKEIAVQQQKQYEQEALAQEQRIAVSEKTARAEKQIDVIAAKLSIDIAADRAMAARREAEGIRDATKSKADGTSYQSKVEGEGVAAAYRAQVEALGKDSVAVLKALEEIRDGKIVITPEILVQGGGDTTGSLVNVLLSQMIRKPSTEKTKST